MAICGMCRGTGLIQEGYTRDGKPLMKRCGQCGGGGTIVDPPKRR